MEKGGAVTVPGQQLDALSDFGAPVPLADRKNTVLRGQVAELEVAAAQGAGSVLRLGQGLEAGVENDVAALAAADRRQHAEGELQAFDVAALAVHRVHEDSAASLQFGDPVEGRGDGVRSGAPGADDVAAMALPEEGIPADNQLFQGLVAGPFLRFGRLGFQHVPLVPHDPLEAQSRPCRDRFGEPDHLLPGTATGAVHADVDVDQHRDGRPCGGCGRCHRLQHDLGVDDRDHPPLFLDLGEPAMFPRAPQLVGEKDIADAVGNHHFRFAELRAGDSEGSSGHQKMGDLR